MNDQGASERLTARKYGSDFIVDLLQRFQIPYVAFNPGASFRGIHDSLVNYLGLAKLPILECTHEEIAVAIAHGYARATGRPMVAIIHNVVGLQHATMAIYNAWCDRVPLLLLGGTGPMSYVNRRPGSDWVHTALVQGNLVRDYVKWDDQPYDLASVPESFARGYQVAMTEPKGPVYLCYDAAIQEDEYDAFPKLPDPERYKPPLPPAAEPEAIPRIAKRLMAAENPVIIADKLGRSPLAYEALVELASTLQIPVIDQGGRHNFPTEHPMCLTELAPEAIGQADVILAFDVQDLYGALHTVDRLTRQTRPLYREDAHIIHVTMEPFFIKSWAHDFRRLQETDELIGADPSLFVPQLLRACREILAAAAGDGYRQRIENRSCKWAGRVDELRKKWLAEAERRKAEQPIALSTLALAIWNVIEKEDWVLANGNLNKWVTRIWKIERQDQYLGKMPGGGLGYGIGASLGVALAFPERLCINIQSDGDFLFTPGGLWTAAHHQIPLLIIMANNRSYYNSEEHAKLIAEHRGRPVENAPIGTRIENPAVDFVKLAEAMGVYGEGPIVRSADIEPALRRALHVVKTQKRPALVDVVIQNR